MKAKLFLGIIAGLLLAGCGNNHPANTGGTPAKPAPATNHPTATATNAAPNYASGNPITAVPDYVGVVGQAQKFSEKKIDLAYLNQAIQMFNVQNGRYPKTLQELVPDYVAKIPAAPYGYKIIYDAKGGQVKVVPQ